MKKKDTTILVRAVFMPAEKEEDKVLGVFELTVSSEPSVAAAQIINWEEQYLRANVRFDVWEKDKK